MQDASHAALTAAPPGPVRATARAAALGLFGIATIAHGHQLDIDGPVGSGRFGTQAVTLSSGNIVVTDPGFDASDSQTDAGAVYLFRPNGTLISRISGSTTNDRVGSGGIVALSSGNFVVSSPMWNQSGQTAAGAVTFGSGWTGVSGVVSPINSLVGTRANDTVGLNGVTALPSGHYLVRSAYWDNGTTVDAGAVTFGSGRSGVTGPVSPDNSLVGSSNFDVVGLFLVKVLANGNYVVVSPNWSNGGLTSAGAATFARGTTGVTGVISAANSLVGGTAFDSVGAAGLTELSTANFVVGSPEWNRGGLADVGAATFGSGVSGISGLVSPSNSLVGSATNDWVGRFVTPLTNGAYVVSSPAWDNGTIVDAGAATFGAATAGVRGVVSPANSLVGNQPGDLVSTGFTKALANGNYVVTSPFWNHGPIVDAGAATFGSGTNGTTGVVSSSNSLVGASENDTVGQSVTPLAQGNYVVASTLWDNGNAPDAGAATFGSGVTGVSGVVSSINSVVGSSAFDRVGFAHALTNGNYLLLSPDWDNGTAVDAGAATFGLGTSGTTGPVSATNSLVGTSTGDRVGRGESAILVNGNYVVCSKDWNRGALLAAGAATLGSGTHGVIGPVSPANSLVGATAGDSVCSGGVTALIDGDYVVGSPNWSSGKVLRAGAATFGAGTSGIVGEISATNSLIGTHTDDLAIEITPLSNGDYVVASPGWDNAGAMDAGAVTLGPGEGGVVGHVSPTNSLVGSSNEDHVGFPAITVLTNGRYLVSTPTWDNGIAVDAGAHTLGSSAAEATGEITTVHSVLGEVANQAASHWVNFDDVRNQLVVGQPAANRVVLHRPGLATVIVLESDTPDPSIDGQQVLLVATVSASAGAPTDGRVVFRASGGENCIAATPTPRSPTTVEFSCEIAIAANGSSLIQAEYVGSSSHAYSGSMPEPHLHFAEVLFADGLESL
jgi:hypothetical protein